jgi:hypothetical protein
MTKPDQEGPDAEKPTDRFTMLCQTVGTVAGIAGTASVIIAWVALVNFSNVTNAGMFAIALMAAAPAAMGVGMALVLYLAFAVEARRSGDSFDHLAAGEFIRRIDRPNP